MAANEPNVCKWFDEYQEVLKDVGIDSLEKLWSGDETRVQHVPKEQLATLLSVHKFSIDTFKVY